MDPQRILKKVTFALPWVDFIDWDVQTRSNVLNGLIAFRDDAHTLSDGFSCDWMITCYHDDLKEGKEGTFALMSVKNQKAEHLHKKIYHNLN